MRKIASMSAGAGRCNDSRAVSRGSLSTWCRSMVGSSRRSPADSVAAMGSWQKRRSRLRQQLAFSVLMTLLASALLLNGIRDHRDLGIVVGVFGVLVGPWGMVRNWRDL